MTEQLQFDTPENIPVHYAPAGLGTRFLSWFVDQMFLALAMTVLLVVLALIGTSFGVVEDVLDPDNQTPEQFGMYVIGIAIVMIGLGSFAYFTLCELFWRGQTPGKKMAGLRVVKVDGFGLDAGSILIRNVFRLVDNIPLTWVIPVLSNRSQRTGDMVAGTVVIFDKLPELSSVRVELSRREASDAEFRFDNRKLERLQQQDYDVVERLLDRWPDVPTAQADKLVKTLITSTTAKMKVELPPENRHVQFLEDLLAAEIRRQNRLLG